MSINYINLPQIQDLLVKKEIEQLPQEVCSEFNTYISASYKWTPFSLDWSLIQNHLEIKLGRDFSENKLRLFLETLDLFSGDSIAVVYSAQQEGLVLEKNTFITLFKSLTVSEICFFFAVEKHSLGFPTYRFDNFAELNGWKLCGITSKSDKSNEIDLRVVHERWLQKRNRIQESSNYLDIWYAAQCGRCQFFVPLTGRIGLDYGACCNLESAFDGIVRFEHDGCIAFTEPSDVI